MSEPLSGGYLAPHVDYAPARTPDEFVARVADQLAGGEPTTRREPGAPARPLAASFHVASLRALVTRGAPPPEAP